jgi:hypothetical protein
MGYWLVRLTRERRCSRPLSKQGKMWSTTHTRRLANCWEEKRTRRKALTTHPGPIPSTGGIFGATESVMASATSTLSSLLGMGHAEPLYRSPHEKKCANLDCACADCKGGRMADRQCKNRTCTCPDCPSGGMKNTRCKNPLCACENCQCAEGECACGK